MESGSLYRECVDDLVSDARRIFESEDLLSLESLPDFILLEDAQRLMKTMVEFRRKCYRTLSKEEYDEINSIINGALLKIAAALKTKKTDDPVAKQIMSMFTEDEIEILREFERFNKLDPEVTPPDRLADLLVSRSGEIYELVAEAVRKQYIDFSGLIKTWTTQGKIRATVSKALQARYSRRFRNIVEAVKRLLDQQPAWLLRLFTDYERALLESAEVRERIEREIREKVEKELGLPELERQVEMLEEERQSLLKRVEELSAALAAREVEREKILMELDYLRRDKEALAEQIERLQSKLGEVEEALESARRELEEKRRELEELTRQYSQDKAAKEALEAEAERLKARIEELEAMLREYSTAKEALEAEKHELEAKLGELEAAIKGEGEERPASLEDALGYENVFIERFNYHMNRLPLILYDPLSRKEIKIKSWGKANIEEGALHPDSSGPKGRFSRYIVYEGVLRKRRKLVVEALSFVRPERYAEKGYDLEPMKLGEALSLASRRAMEARNNGYYHVLMIMSPTGFSKKLQEYVAGTDFHRMFLSSSLTLILFDPLTGDVYHHPADPVVGRFAAVLRPLTPLEEIEKAALKIKELKYEALARSPAFPHFRLKELVEKTGMSPKAVRAAVEKLQKEGVGMVKVEKGEIVFVYKEAA